MNKKPQHKGHGLEQNVAEIYRDRGYWNVKTNQFYKKTVHREIITREFDIVYYRMFEKRYTECKYHCKTNVGIAEVEEFYAKLRLFLIDTIHAEMITNQGYSSPAQAFAKEKGIQLIDGKQLTEMESTRKKDFSLAIMCYRGLDAYNKKGVLGVINYVFPRLLPLDRQIDNYTR